MTHTNYLWNTGTYAFMCEMNSSKKLQRIGNIPNNLSVTLQYIKYTGELLTFFSEELVPILARFIPRSQLST